VALVTPNPPGFCSPLLSVQCKLGKEGEEEEEKNKKKIFLKTMCRHSVSTLCARFTFLKKIIA